MNSRRTFLRTSATAAAAALLGGLASGCHKTATPNSGADCLKTIATRRSVRKFKPDPVPQADLIRILDAARLAPTSGNQQPWKFLVIRDPAKIAQMKEACVQWVLGFYDKRTDNTSTREETEKLARGRYDDYLSAPVHIVVLTDAQSQYPDYNHWDGPLGAGYLMLAARELGYGTVFITDAIPDEVTKKVLQIPDRYTRVCITPLGVPVEWPVSPPKRKLDEFIAYETL